MSHHLEAAHISPEMHACIDRCSDCHDVCVATTVHCLTQGGEHASSEHIGALLDCAQACDTSRDFMLRASPLHHHTCGICAEACERCAESCERIDDEAMRRCADRMSPLRARARRSHGRPGSSPTKPCRGEPDASGVRLSSGPARTGCPSTASPARRTSSGRARASSRGTRAPCPCRSGRRRGRECRRACPCRAC